MTKLTRLKAIFSVSIRMLVYKITYRRARAWPSLKAECSRAKVSCIQFVCMHDTFARAKHSAYAAARPSARATIGYLVYKQFVSKIPLPARRARPKGRRLCEKILTSL